MLPNVGYMPRLAIHPRTTLTDIKQPHSSEDLQRSIVHVSTSTNNISFDDISSWPRKRKSSCITTRTRRTPKGKPSGVKQLADQVSNPATELSGISTSVAFPTPNAYVHIFLIIYICSSQLTGSSSNPRSSRGLTWPPSGRRTDASPL